MWTITHAEEWGQRPGSRQTCSSLRTDRSLTNTAMALEHKLRRAMVRPGRERLTGLVEVDETYWGAVKKKG